LLVARFAGCSGAAAGAEGALSVVACRLPSPVALGPFEAEN